MSNYIKENVLDKYEPFVNGKLELAATDDKELILRNMRFMVHYFRSYAKILGYDEFISEICVGMMDALGRFDKTKKYKFSTFARYYVWNALTAAQYKKDNALSMSPTTIKKQMRIKKYMLSFYKEHNRVPTMAEVTKALKISEKTYNEISYIKSNTAFSLDARISADDENSKTILDVFNIDDMHNNTEECSSEYMYDSIEKSELADAIKTLPKEQKEVVNKYQSNMSFKQIARILKKDLTDVEVLYNKAVNKLKQHFAVA